MPMDPSGLAAPGGPGAVPGAGGAGGPPGASPGAGPMGSPMSQPSEQAGEKQQGMAMVQTAIDILSQALPKLGLMTDEGEAVMGALKSLGKKVGSKAGASASLQPAQIEMMKNAAGGGPDVAQLMAMQGGGGPRPGGPGGPFMQ